MSTKPTYVYMTVDYTEQKLESEEPTPEFTAAVRATYRGVRLEVQYGTSPEQTRVFNSGEFATDYNAAVKWVAQQTEGREVPFMGSSSVDHFMFDAGYTEE